MSDTYTGRDMDRRYEGDQVDVTYNVKRCIHAAECVNRLSAVFDTQQRPWIQVGATAADDVARVVELCPSGALHYARKDGGPAEAAPAVNRIIVWDNGPLQFVGDLEINSATVAMTDETRATLCRCGASHNKPFCDNSHTDAGFTATEVAPTDSQPDSTGGKLKITANASGPLLVEGHFEIVNQRGETLHTGSKTWLCRCGGSARKPFCDGTHNANGFEAE